MIHDEQVLFKAAYTGSQRPSEERPSPMWMLDNDLVYVVWRPKTGAGEVVRRLWTTMYGEES